MHELAIAEHMFEIISKNIDGKKDLERVSITLGPLSGISAESLSFCFDEVAFTKGFGKPLLLINKTLANIRCRNCNIEYKTDDFYNICPNCSSVDKEILSGNEFTIDSVEVKQDIYQ